MPELPSIPLTHQEGVYKVADFSGDLDDDNAVSLDYDRSIK